MKVKIEGVIEFKTSEYGNDNYHGFFFHALEMSDYGYINVMPYTIEVEIPDEFDPRSAQIAALEKEKTALRAACQKSITNIERHISELLALDNIPGAV